MDDKLYKGVLFAQPVAVCTTLFFSRLYRYVSGIDEKRPWSHGSKSDFSLHAWVWRLQALMSLVLLSIIILDIRLITWSDIKASASEILKAGLASRLGLLLYFAAGLLPDVDIVVGPEVPHLHAWIIALAFQVVVLVPPKSFLQTTDKPFEMLWYILEGSFAALLVFTSLVFTFRRKRSKDCDSAYTSIASAESSGTYGAIQSDDEAKASRSSQSDAQSTGWFDYFVGFRELFPYFWPSDSPKHQLITIFCFGLLIAQRVINILVPYQLGVLVDTLGRGKMPYKQLTLYCLYRGLQGQQGVIGSFRAILWIPISQNLYRRLACAAYEHVMMLSLDFHLSKRTGEVMSALSKGGALNTFLDGFAFQLFPMVFDIGVAAVYLFVTSNALYSIITVGVLWSYVFATIYMAKWRGRQRRVMTTRDREMEAAKTDTIMAYETVHHCSALPLEMSRFAEYVGSFQHAEFSVLFSLNALNALQNFMFIFGVVLVATLSAYQISIGQASVASFVTIITYFAQLQAPLAFFGSFYNQVQNNLVDAERMLKLFTEIPDVQDSPSAQPLLHPRGLLEFRNVTFAYGSRRPALKDVSFIVQPGTTTALVGESGSGKSTCLKLMFRFYDTQGGCVRIDDCNVRHLTLESLRHTMGVVGQETVLFNESLMYNIKYSNPDASDEAVYDACRTASIHEKILSFPEKYATMVGERGMKLSGGEKQRIALARTILQDPTFILLDEASSSLDSETESKIQEALKEVTKNKTTIAIAHRLSTITHADQILVMHEGELVERGTHQSLLALRGRYTALWEKQTKLNEGVKATEQ